MAEPFQGRVASTNENGFKLDGGEAWINYSKPEYGYVGPVSVRVGWIIEVTASQSKAGGWFASNVVVLDDSASPQASAAPPAPPQPAPAAPQPAQQASPAPVPQPTAAPASYQGYYDAAAAAQAAPEAEKPAPGGSIPTAAAPTEANLPGSFAYKDSVAIPKAVALNDAKDIVIAMLTAPGIERAQLTNGAEIRNLTIWLAQSLYFDFLAFGAEGEVEAQPQGGDPGPQEAPA